MRILLFSTLFPNAKQPSHGVFVENRLRAYLENYDADIKVIAPVPWFPFRHSAFGEYAVSASVPFRENRNGIDILHPRYVIPPKIAMHVAPSSLTHCLDKAVRNLRDEGWDFDFIDGHYLYPDGVAATRIARRYDKPIVLTGRGTDINLLPSFKGPRKAILEAANRADHIITVAAALKDELARLGVAKEKVSVLRNGVDLKLFRPADRDEERRALGVDGPVLASVGHLIDRKGHDLVIQALSEIENATLIIAGEGPERDNLATLAKRLGLENRVKFLGRIAHNELYRVYSAADVLVLASSREGWPNVLLEALACGTPCVATNVWGSGEVINAPAAGRLVNNRTAKEIAAETNTLLNDLPPRQETRVYAEQYSWEETAHGMQRIFKALHEKATARKSISIKPITPPNADKRPKLIVTVDTEEEFDWNEFHNMRLSVSDIRGVQIFQEVCEAFEAKPLYFVTSPLLEDKRTAEYFRALKDARRADFGIHLHQWATSPGDFPSEYYSFQMNLPREVLREKLQNMAAQYEAVFGDIARSHRAGRYGIAREDYAYLAEIGIKYDFSPSAGFDFHTVGGPDFSDMTNMPFMISGPDWAINVTPVSGAKAFVKSRKFLSQEINSRSFSHRKDDRLSSVKRALRLSPEGAGLEDLKALTSHLIKEETPVLSFSLHSTSFVPGGNDYAKSSSDVEEILRRTADYLAWFKDEIGGDIVDLSALERLYAKPFSA
ncbi:glycosyltransferase [Hyphococcus formosus]|uniref:glycosyltransferase n=1 Tax=Hyphococcus formosus TaxID=3143534 RepID=UPI00398B0AF6